MIPCCRSQPLHLGNPITCSHFRCYNKYFFVFSLICIVGSLISLGYGGGGYFELISLNYSFSLILMGAGTLALTLSLLFAIYFAHQCTPHLNFRLYVAQYNNVFVNHSLHGVFTLSTDTRIAHTMEQIERFNLTPSSHLKCHIGVGGLHNFDIMAARRSDMGVILDFNPQNKAFMEAAFVYILRANTPQEFVEGIVAYMHEGHQSYNHYQGYDSPIQRMQRELNRPTSWLYAQTPERFQHIKTLVTQEKICALTEDFSHSETLRTLREDLEIRFGCRLDTIYLSNMSAYLTAEAFYRAFDALSPLNPIVIHCTSPRECRCQERCHCPKVQHISREWTRVNTSQRIVPRESSGIG